MTESMKNSILTHKQISKFRKHFDEDPSNRLFMNAITRGNIQDIAINRHIINTAQFSFSHEIETKSGITDQKRSGTCWMFAELNWLRTMTQKQFKMEDIEFSQNYLMFWDKLEKTNYILEKLLELRGCDLNDRRVHFLLKNPTSDGGEWHMIVNLIRKYGLVPKSVMPDTSNRENSRFINELLGFKIREAAAQFWKLHAEGKTEKEIRKVKDTIMEDAFRILVICMGTPPEKFDWSYRDKDKAYHQEIQITPVEFRDKYLSLNFDEIYTLASCPSESTEFGKVYSIEYFQNMIGGIEWTWLNLPIKHLKRIAVEMLKNGEAVLYGCDVLQESHTKEGLLYDELYDYESIFKTKFNMDKPTRLNYSQSVLTHSMVLVGVELVEDKPVRWKVENSWGEEPGKKGYFIMSDKWFEEHTLDLIVPKKYLTEKHLADFDQEPIILPPWHFMA